MNCSYLPIARVFPLEYPVYKTTKIGQTNEASNQNFVLVIQILRAFLCIFEIKINKDKIYSILTVCCFRLTV
jgi:hypothetical protein